MCISTEECKYESKERIQAGYTMHFMPNCRDANRPYIHNTSRARETVRNTNEARKTDVPWPPCSLGLCSSSERDSTLQKDDETLPKIAQ